MKVFLFSAFWGGQYFNTLSSESIVNISDEVNHVRYSSNTKIKQIYLSQSPDKKLNKVL